MLLIAAGAGVMASRRSPLRAARQKLRPPTAADAYASPGLRGPKASEGVRPGGLFQIRAAGRNNGNGVCFRRSAPPGAAREKYLRWMMGLGVPGPSHRLGLMDEAGVAVQVLSISAPNVFRLPAGVRAPLTRDLNDELAAMADGAGGRLRVFANLPLPDVDQSLAELDRVLGRDGMVGVMVCTTIDRRTLDDGLFGPLWEELDRRSAAVLVHPTTPCCTEGVRDFALSLALDFLAETTNAIGRLVYSGVFERYRRIRWIFSHLGGTTPFVVHRFDNYARQFPEARANITEPPSEYLRRLSFDTVSTHAEAMRCAFATFDPGQFVFGTDYPHVPGGLQIFVDTLGPPASPPPTKPG